MKRSIGHVCADAAGAAAPVTNVASAAAASHNLSLRIVVLPG